MARDPFPINALVPGFCESDLIDFSQRAAKKSGLTQDTINILISNGDINDLPSFYEPSVPSEEDGDVIVVPRRMPQFMIRLAEDFGESESNKVLANLLIGNPDTGAYETAGDPFFVFDPFRKWRHSIDGDEGWIEFDDRRQLFIMRDMNSPTARKITLSADLGDLTENPSGVAATDTDSGQTISNVYGDFVKSGKKIKKTSNAVSALWYPKANSGAGRWRAHVSRECLI